MTPLATRQLDNAALTLPILFDAAVRRWPRTTALELPPSDGRRRQALTYTELKAQADTLTTALLTAAGPNNVVAVLLPRTTPWFYAAQLGVLRAGAAHVCLDPVFPDQHLCAVLADCHASLVLTDTVGKTRLQQAGYGGRLLAIDQVEKPSPGPFPVSADPDQPAYLIYTSGTTGRPKGVMISHRSIVSLIRSDITEFGLRPGDRIAQSSSCAYDSSVEETWMALASGATLVVMDDEAVRLGPDLMPWLRCERITVLCPPPTLLRSTGCTDPKQELPDLRLLYVGGEALPEDIAATWSVGPRMVNGYGPTECTVTCVRQDIRPGKRIGIGHPVPGMRAWVLDDNLQPVPLGERGELCMSGTGLALGYLNQPELTSSRFPVHPRLGRLYRTGDVVHRETDGALVYHGRADAQVKLRGYRIELEAVEAHLTLAPGVREAACRVQGQGPAQILAAHIVPADPFQPPLPDDLAGRLRQELPAHMVPARFGFITELPRSVSGKLRRDRLPLLLPAPSSLSSGNHEAAAADPGEGVLRLIAKTASQVLGLAHVDADADFFTSLGGSSLHAAQLISGLRAYPSTASLAVGDVYKARTVRGLAQVAERQSPRVVSPTGSASPPPDVPALGNPFLATVVQTVGLTAGLLVVSVPAYLVGFRLLPLVYGMIGAIPMLLLAPVVLPLTRLLLAPVAVLAVVAAKRALVGVYVPESVPVWSDRAVRIWLVRQAVRIVPWRSIAGTEYQCMALRALGARIGKRVHIHRGVDLSRGGWDLLEIGDDVTLSQDAAVRLVSLEQGQVVFGPVLLGDRSTLDVRAGIGPYTHVGVGAWLSALSSLPVGGRIPAGEMADGVPARPIGPVPPVPTLTHPGRELSPAVHGAATLLAQAGLQAVLAAPYVLLAILALTLGGSGDESSGHTPESLPLALCFAAGASLGVASSLLLQALTVRLLGAADPGVISRWSPGYIRIWLKTGMVDSAGTWLSGTLLWPRWLRLAGMQVGRDCEVSTVIDVVPELVRIGQGSFLADGIYLGGPRIHSGTVRLAPLRLGEATFVGNHAVLPCGRTLPDGLLIGIATSAGHSGLRPGTSWFGHPAFELPRREIIQADRSMTHEPSATRRISRWFWELARFAIPAVLVVEAAGWLLAVDTAGAIVPPVWMPLTLSAVTLLWAALPCGAVLALKWALLGRVRPATHGLWTCWCSRWDFLYVVWAVVAKPFLTPLEGTLLLPLYLRRMGMRIGKRVVLGEGFAQVVDPDMIEIGDGATVSAMFQAHTFEDRVLKIARIRVGARATLATNTVLLYGAVVGEGATVAAHSVVMKQERLLPELCYEGVPTRHRKAAPA
ncbi:amino acid adenylation domain-containing protein [Kitasatospora sp. NPDC089509]|uniref:amino acid adenylation domain-containing protein n=1 Tax=Kitasatospora sp. NPDC089509 TaxID=3364079 RepID=UPI0038244E39